VAVLSRRESVGDPRLLSIGNPLFPDEQRRLLAVSAAGITTVCAYFPNGQALDSDKFQYKLAWIDALAQWLAKLRETNRSCWRATSTSPPRTGTCTIPRPGAGQLHCSGPGAHEIPGAGRPRSGRCVPAVRTA
jgi:exodeoxyribonuclease-3